MPISTTPSVTSSAVRAFPRLLLAGAALLVVACSDGVSFSRTDQFGRTYYIDGAGNWGFGVAEVQQGLRRAGYQGNIVNYLWSPTFNPALDQTIGRLAAHLKGIDLGRQISRYLQKYPNNTVNVIALSAGTGVAIWGCESTLLPAKVNNVILLGSSLSANYDMTQALQHIGGKVYVYHSESDMILQGPVRALGTIDGKLGVDAAGIAGLHPPHGAQGKVVNIGWSSSYERYGWTGSHTDATCEPFVCYELSKHILPQPPSNSPPAPPTHSVGRAESPATAQPAPNRKRG